MFSGIVEEAAQVVALNADQGNLHITMKCSFVNELKIDQSVAHNGVCLTVVSLTDDTYGVFTSTWQSVNEGARGSGHAVGNLTFNASNNNPIYGNSDTVTPLTYTVRAFICYA